MVHLVSEKTDLRRVGHAVDRAVPVPRRAHALVLGERRGEALLLLRLRRGRRRVQVRAADGGARLPGGRGAAGRALGRAGGARGGRSEGRAAPPPARAAARAAGPGGAVLRDLPARRRRGRGRARISRITRTFRRGARRVPGGLLAERLGPDAGRCAAGRLQRGGAGGRGPCPARPRRRSLRPVPGPDHVPPGRRPWTSPGLRSQADGGGARPEVPEHLRERPLPQGSPALRHRRCPERGDEDRSVRRRRGLHRCACATPGRDRRGRGDHGHGDDPGAARGAGQGGRLESPRHGLPRSRCRSSGPRGDAEGGPAGGGPRSGSPRDRHAGGHRSGGSGEPGRSLLRSRSEWIVPLP